MAPVLSKNSKSTNSNSPIFILEFALDYVFSPEIYKIAHYLGKEQKQYSIRLGQDQNGDLTHTRIEDMAAECVEGIQKLQPEGPYYLVGNCSGGLVAFELANQLYNQGQKVALLALLDSPSPKQVFRWTHRINPRFLPVFEALGQARDCYEPQVYPGKLIMFQSTEHPPECCYESQVAWRRLATGGLEVHKIPGDHQAIFKEPGVQLLAQKLKTYLISS